MAIDQGELTNPAHELHETCQFLNVKANPSNELTLAFLERRLDCQNSTAVLFTVLAALNRRFETLEACLRKSVLIPVSMRDDAIRQLGVIRNAVRPNSLQHTWEGVRGSAFTDANQTALLYLGPSLQPEFPLRKLSPEDRKYLIRHTRKALAAAEDITSQSIFGAIAVTSLRSVLIILERLEAFGVDALVEATITSFTRLTAAEQEAKQRGESPKILRRLNHAVKMMLIIHGAVTFVNDGWTTYEELWGRSQQAVAWITSQIYEQKALPAPQKAITYQPGNGDGRAID